MNNQPDFSTWERVNLVNIASDMYLKLQHQDIEMQQLKLDFKDALVAYRQLIIKDDES